ncbi:MAG: hypothetical protein LC794_19100 [Acidobacteria bacterium]|nr:hypothetical protein [Acidobacteriota bacterium]
MDKSKKGGADKPRPTLPTVRRETYNGHEIVIPTDERSKRISIDGRSVYYGVTNGGEYYLDKYAYDRAKSLDEVIKRYVDYLDRVEKSGREGK